MKNDSAVPGKRFFVLLFMVLAFLVLMTVPDETPEPVREKKPLSLDSNLFPGLKYKSDGCAPSKSEFEKKKKPPPGLPPEKTGPPPKNILPERAPLD